MEVLKALFLLSEKEVTGISPNLKPRDPVILALCTQDSFQKAWDKAKEGLKEKKRLLREEKSLKKKIQKNK